MTTDTTYERTVAQMRDEIAGLNDMAELVALAGDDRVGVQNAIKSRAGELALAATEGVPLPVAEHEPPPAEGAPLPVAEPDPALEAQEWFQAAPDQVTEVEDIFTNAENAPLRGDEANPITGGTVTHKGPPLRVMYKAERNGYYIPVVIPKGNVGGCLAEGFEIRCPYCGDPYCRARPGASKPRHVRRYGCPALPPQPFMRCPECQKKEYDTSPLPEALALKAAPLHVRAEAAGIGMDEQLDDDGLAPGELSNELFGDSTSESRIQAKATEHMLGTHPQEAAGRGFRPQSPRDRIIGSAEIPQPAGRS